MLVTRYLPTQYRLYQSVKAGTCFFRLRTCNFYGTSAPETLDQSSVRLLFSSVWCVCVGLRALPECRWPTIPAAPEHILPTDRKLGGAAVQRDLRPAHNTLLYVVSYSVQSICVTEGGCMFLCMFLCMKEALSFTVCSRHILLLYLLVPPQT